MSRKAAMFSALLILTTACGSSRPQGSSETVDESVVEVTREVVVTSPPKAVEVEVTRLVTPEAGVSAQSMSIPRLNRNLRLAFEDDFDAGPGEWRLFNVPEASVYPSNGELIIEVHSPTLIFVADQPEFGQFIEYVFEVDISSRSESNWSAGVVFRCDEEFTEALAFSIHPPSHFSVSKFIIGNDGISPERFLPIAFFPVWAPVGEFYHVRLVDELWGATVFVNDELLTSFLYDDAFPGCPGIFVEASQEGGDIWAFDNIRVYAIEN